MWRYLTTPFINSLPGYVEIKLVIARVQALPSVPEPVDAPEAFLRIATLNRLL